MSGRMHLMQHRLAAERVAGMLPRVEGWGRELAVRLLDGRRLLVAGNGGSAAQAEHLAAELVGRYLDDRVPLSAIALHSDGAAHTACSNDYGAELAFARGVRAHGRPGDVFLGLSTSGRSANVIEAAHQARTLGLSAWALTGPAPNELAEAGDQAICIPAASTAVVQELHLVVLHLVCEAVDAQVARSQRLTGVAEA